ncbi:MAG: cupredoxin domain-containing protein [Microthrixaceae bacterium]
MPVRPSVRRALGAVPLVALALAGVVGCSSDEAATKVAVTGTNDACTAARTQLPAGSIAFDFTNKADKVNELYVVREGGEVVGEVENVTTGTSRTLTADLSAGTYTLRCKPGQGGNGIESTVKVTGSGGAAAAAADRTVTFDAADFAYKDLDVSGITKGQSVKFAMTNSGAQNHEFEVVGPDGETVGEIAEIAPGANGTATITFTEPGEYTYQCILKDPADGMQHDMKGMKGTFTVAAS